ncbi:hypothetical protein F2Q70_00022118 [Brassica cretica]|uniref:Uncharacterized protein n=1 Tax=Brassica cretica TaxID=69181 RepID=A0A8S9GJ32_BRACR|nr:hypothetical protein F2Q70_00022118 [Brassica cretica]
MLLASSSMLANWITFDCAAFNVLSRNALNLSRCFCGSLAIRRTLGDLHRDGPARDICFSFLTSTPPNPGDPGGIHLYMFDLCSITPPCYILPLYNFASDLSSLLKNNDDRRNAKNTNYECCQWSSYQSYSIHEFAYDELVDSAADFSTSRSSSSLAEKCRFRIAEVSVSETVVRVLIFLPCFAIVEIEIGDFRRSRSDIKNHR